MISPISTCSSRSRPEVSHLSTLPSRWNRWQISGLEDKHPSFADFCARIRRARTQLEYTVFEVRREGNAETMAFLPEMCSNKNAASPYLSHVKTALARRSRVQDDRAARRYCPSLPQPSRSRTNARASRWTSTRKALYHLPGGETHPSALATFSSGIRPRKCDVVVCGWSTTSINPRRFSSPRHDDVREGMHVRAKTAHTNPRPFTRSFRLHDQERWETGGDTCVVPTQIIDPDSRREYVGTDEDEQSICQRRRKYLNLVLVFLVHYHYRRI